jgi:S1-C subfamily serine protease
MRWLADVSAVVAVLLAVGCTAAPPPSTSAAETAAADPAGSVPAEPRDLEAPGELRADGLERALRHATLRVRARGCFGVASGSGFALDGRTLVTNRHVVAGASDVQVATWDGRSSSTDLVSVAVHGDLALVRVDDPLPVALPLGDDPGPGDLVTVVGYPLGGAVTVEGGTVIDDVPGHMFDEPGRVVRLDAHIEQGSSGGPVVDDDGQVAAVIFAIEVSSGRALAVPVSTLEGAVASGTFSPVESLC